MVTALAEKYSAPVPRYTSYPTAPHFQPVTDSGFYAKWLSELDPTKPLSLYFHVPFCREMCWYCGCHTKVTKKYEPIADYAEAMRAELNKLMDVLPGRFALSHVHWGGGTPSILSADDFKSIMGMLEEGFEYTPDAERAIEIDPRTADAAKVKALAEAGINRASLGIQDFNPGVQAAINRIQSFELTKEVVDNLRHEGITQLNFDLMYGLPLQTTDDVRRTIELSHELKPSRVALFGYAHVPWMKTHMKMIREEALPQVKARVEQATVAADCLQELGYVMIGLDHFAHPDDPMAVALADNNLKRNFQGYTTDDAEALIGIGASAIGRLPQGYTQNIVSIPEYKRTVFSGAFPLAKALEVTAEDILRREVIETLMCNLEIDLAGVLTKHSISPDFFDDELSKLENFKVDGLVNIKGKAIEVTEEGRFLVRTICAVFDTYMGRGVGKHSRAI
ncbi:oxygen-independent coproporphyrinogen III oxidase [Sneathiella limimaris]|uniref:oxygen-independent coproporphyrinogen III oxidase n=1 Tax=Sneathiella limimaris TaxID=1964213 RepID=UPI00146C1D11|nr:oxygen-independent coproporphyrinogen III oxidase [Sneathiella limimaris]